VKVNELLSPAMSVPPRKAVPVGKSKMMQAAEDGPRFDAAEGVN
jgi:hypothetical protein